MTASLTPSYLNHPAFKRLTPEGRNLLQSEGSVVRFGIGQSLSDGKLIPHRALLILEGQARLLTLQASRLITIAKMGAGAFVGMASILRASPCENITASTDLTALVIPDQLIIRLLAQEPGFREWATKTLFPAEVLDLLQQHLDVQNTSTKRIKELFPAFLKGARLVIPQSESDETIGNGQPVYLASANAESLALGTRINTNHPLPKARPPLPLRLISLTEELIADIQRSEDLETNVEKPVKPQLPEEAPQLAREEHLPLGTSIELGQLDSAKRLRLVSAKGSVAETLACLQMIGQWLGVPFRKDGIEKILMDSSRRNKVPDIPIMGQLVAGMGLHVVSARVPAASGTRLQTPALVSWEEGFAVVASSNSGGMKLASPRSGWVMIPPAELEKSYPKGIEVLFVERTINTPGEKFGFNWFLPALQRHRKVLIQVLVASFVIQLFSLANPLLIQVIIDKVIRQRSLDTLQVLGIGLVIVTLLEGILTSLRTFLFAETTNRIDSRLGAEVIDHLLRLPLGYFDRRPVGELGTRIGELEKIRNFLTGQALTTVVDAAFSVIYVAVMLIYSWVLTLVALAVVPIQVAITLLGAPVFRRQFRKAAEENARTQSHLVEVLTGIQTVKAQNVEMVSRWKWQDYYGRYIARSFDRTITGTALSQTSQVLQKLSQLLVLWVGASLVLAGKLTLGQLIAFRIISGFVTQPLLRLSTIWQTIQELRVSFERLADVLDTPQESDEIDQAKIPLDPIQGNVRFEAVSFRFGPGSPEVLHNVSLEVKAGTFVGVVGQSGSGKSTLMKLLPRLYSPTSGRILVDGTDIDKVELYSLRRQIGIVPQDPLLFSGSVAENIALTNPEASSEEIVRAAKIACAHEFIMELQSGYSTPVGERGASLSGGQRQRLAIARTLLSKPRLMVMDEATSALDYDTERRVCENLRKELNHCTVFFITHRLSTVRNADLIVMMHQGVIAESGKHEQMIASRARYYALFRQQESL